MLRRFDQTQEPSLEEKRDKILRVIFRAFAKSNGIPPVQIITFDEIQEQQKILDLKEFLKFCKDFEIPLTAKVQLNVFKRVIDTTAKGSIYFEDFKMSL